MNDEPEMTSRQIALREDMTREYYALNDAVDRHDGRLMIVKGWSVTLSFAALGLGFQHQHYALFGLGAATAATFWFLDGLMKGYQVRCYSRMRDIEVAAFHLNSVQLGELGSVSSPRINMSWHYVGGEPDWRTRAPERQTSDEIRRLFRKRFLLSNVVLPHLPAVLLGSVLFLAAASDSWGLEGLSL